MRNLVHSLAASGVSIIIANHLLGEVEKVCDRILLLQEGKTIDIIETNSIGRQQCFEWEVKNAQALYRELSSVEGIRVMDVDLHSLVFTAEDQSLVPPLHNRLVAGGHQLGECIERKLKLEDIFYASLLHHHQPEILQHANS